ncbi:MAG: hypothetical protein NVS2B8_17640 [Vulcanimicrobiaceae bacterium]
MTDTIAVRDIRAYGKHGANPGERDYVQPFDIDIELGVEIARARASDELAETIDYAAMRETIVGLVASLSYRLLERLGDEILTAVTIRGSVMTAAITIAKPKLLAGATPSVRLHAARP